MANLVQRLERAEVGGLVDLIYKITKPLYSKPAVDVVVRRRSVGRRTRSRFCRTPSPRFRLGRLLWFLSRILFQFRLLKIPEGCHEEW